MMTNAIVTWLVAAMTSWITPEPSHVAMYAEYATSIEHVAYDPTEEPLYRGEGARARTALLLASIASYEGGFQEAVDRGWKRGDHGESVCLMQVRLPGRFRIVMDRDVYTYSKSIHIGWSKDDLIADREKCFRAALHIARESMKICRNLSVYTTGKCLRHEPTSREREARASKYWRSLPISYDESLASK